jgi:hypothetical protein
MRYAIDAHIVAYSLADHPFELTKDVADQVVARHDH